MICLVIAAGLSIFIALPIAIWIGPTIKDPDERKEFLEHL